MFKKLICVCLLCAPAFAGTWSVNGVTPSQSASEADTIETVLSRGNNAASASIFGLLNIGAWGYLQMGSWAGDSSIDATSCGARQAGRTATGSSQTIGSMAYGAQQIGYVHAGARSIGTNSYAASQIGYNSGTQTIDAWAAGARQFGWNTGPQTIGVGSSGAVQSGRNDANEQIGNRQSIGYYSEGASQSGWSLGSLVIGDHAAGASQQGFVAGWATATNNGVGAMQLLELFNGENALTTADGASSLLLGAGIVSNKNSIVAGNGGYSHGDGSITATGGFFGNATSASVVTGNQSNTIATALQPGATNILWNNTTTFVLITSLESMQYPVFNIPLNGWTDFELKASTNNFKPADTNNLLLWYESLGTGSYPAWAVYRHADLNAQTYYCNPDAAGYDGRSWILATNNLSLTEQIGVNGNYQETVVCIPSMTVNDGGTNTWMYPGNEHLVWSYRRRTAAYGETNALGRMIWHPIVPSQWRRTPMDVHF